MVHRKAENARPTGRIRVDAMADKDGVDHELQLRLGERLSEADARAAAEADELRRDRAAVAAAGEPAFGIEDAVALEALVQEARAVAKEMGEVERVRRA